MEEENYGKYCQKNCIIIWWRWLSRLNAVIRTITKTAISKYGYEVIGFVYGYRGLYHNNYVELTEESVEDIYKEGGTILYSSNKDNLFDYLVDDGHGGKVKKDVSDVAVENLKKMVLMF